MVFATSSAYRDHLFKPDHVRAVKKCVSVKVKEENGYTYAMPVTATGYEVSPVNNNSYHLDNQANSRQQNLSAINGISTPMDLTTKAA